MASHAQPSQLASPSCFPIQSAVVVGGSVPPSRNGPSNQRPSIRPLLPLLCCSLVTVSCQACVSLSHSLSLSLLCAPLQQTVQKAHEERPMNLLYSSYREYIEDLELQYVDYLTYSFPSLASCSGLFAPLHTSIVVSLSLVSVCPFISVSLMSLALAPLLAPLPPLQPRPAHGRWAGQWPRWTACQKGIVSSDLPK